MVDLGESQRKRQMARRIVLLNVYGWSMVGLGIVAVVTQHHGRIPKWDGLLVAIGFWGGLIFLLVRLVLVRMKRRHGVERPEGPPADQRTIDQEYIILRGSLLVGVGAIVIAGLAIAIGSSVHAPIVASVIGGLGFLVFSLTIVIKMKARLKSHIQDQG
jgi:FtsH-binding integral membrane protein